MLIDLVWDRAEAADRPRAGGLTEFTTDAGSLAVAFKLGDTLYRRRIANRLGPGVYEALDLYNDLPLYTAWEPVCWLEELKKRLRAVEAAAEPGARKAARREYIRRCCTSEFGTAASLKDVFRYGRSFVRSPDPFVLQVRYYDPAEDGGAVWRNAGPWIGPGGVRSGRAAPAALVLQFAFIALVPKRPPPGRPEEFARAHAPDAAAGPRHD